MSSLNPSQTSLNGLVLAGGRSNRMGEDKGLVQWHGKEQRYYVADMLTNFCKEVFISCRTEQVNAIDKKYRAIEDEIEDKGPLGAIVSAFHTNPNVAWLVVACDLPLLDEKTIYYLNQNRDEDCIATTFKSPGDGLPEPLVTIWEPLALPLLEAALSKGRYSPQKVLLKAKIKMLQPPDASALMNVNTPEEKKIVMQMIRSS